MSLRSPAARYAPGAPSQNATGTGLPSTRARNYQLELRSAIGSLGRCPPFHLRISTNARWVVRAVLRALGHCPVGSGDVDTEPATRTASTLRGEMSSCVAFDVLRKSDERNFVLPAAGGAVSHWVEDGLYLSCCRHSRNEWWNLGSSRRCFEGAINRVRARHCAEQGLGKTQTGAWAPHNNSPRRVR